MSLIPSESLNFPDSFRANVGWRLDELDDADGSLPPPHQPDGNLVPSSVKLHTTATETFSAAPPAPFEPPPSLVSQGEPAPSAEPQGEGDDRQLELIPKAASDEQLAAASPGPVEMNALLQYFLSGAAVPAPSVAVDQPNGETAFPPEDVATVSGVVPTNVPVESPGLVAPPNEPLTVAPVSFEPIAEPPFAEPEPAAASNAKSSQQSIVAALESLSHTDVEAPIGSVEIQTPAQANHIFELIAAAVQRGALVGQTVPEPSGAPQPIVSEPPSSPPFVAPAPVLEPPASDFSIAQKPVSPSPATPARAPEPTFSVPSAVVPEQEFVARHPTAVTKPSPSVPAVVPRPTISAAPVHEAPPPTARDATTARATSEPVVPKAPAKIRITPRKIKPRPQLPPTQDEAASVPSLDPDLAKDVSPEEKVSPALERKRVAPIETEPKMAAKTLEPLERLSPRPELSARKIAAARLEIAQSDLFSVDARQRRNRWIGFGLSELAILTALILLGRYGFTHHFPDPTLKMLVFILIFAAAAVAIALPVAFFRNDPQRWDRVGR